MTGIESLRDAPEKPQPRQYVCGLLFDNTYIGTNEGECVALVQKKYPAWQEGYLNGIGGEIEEGEIPMQAMAREFYEETDLHINDWTHFCTLRTKSAIIHWFTTKLHRPMVLRTKTSEWVDWHLLDRLDRTLLIPNTRWLVTMAMVGNDGPLGSMWPYEVFEPSERAT